MKTHEQPPPVPKTIWAYAYEMDPPQAGDRLDAIKTFLEHAHADATNSARTWECRFVVEPRITHILIVSDDPEQDSGVNRRLEAELRRLEVGFSLTAPLAVPGDPAPPEVDHG